MSRKKVLVIDDENSNRALLPDLLEQTRRHAAAHGVRQKLDGVIVGILVTDAVETHDHMDLLDIVRLFA